MARTPGHGVVTRPPLRPYCAPWRPSGRTRPQADRRRPGRPARLRRPCRRPRAAAPRSFVAWPPQPGAAGARGPPPAGAADRRRRRPAAAALAGRAPARSGWCWPPCWSARRCSAGTTTSSTATATGRHDRARQAARRGLLDPGTVWFALACAVLLRRPAVVVERGHRRRRLPDLAWSVGPARQRRCCARGLFSWLPWAVSYALLPGVPLVRRVGRRRAPGGPPEIAMTVLAALLGVGVHVLRALPGLVADNEDGLAAPAAAARPAARRAPAAASCSASAWPAAGRVVGLLPWARRRPARRTARGRGPLGCARTVHRTPRTGAADGRPPTTCEGLEHAPATHHRRSVRRHALARARRAAADVVRLQLRDRPGLHPAAGVNNRDGSRRRARRRDRLDRRTTRAPSSRRFANNDQTDGDHRRVAHRRRRRHTCRPSLRAASSVDPGGAGQPRRRRAASRSPAPSRPATS